MPINDKAKNAGKFIVVMLCFAILFFLLLPFLEDPSTAAAARDKKASPQIFTSNPLTELARKVYSLFSNKYRSPRRAAEARNIRWPDVYAQNNAWPESYPDDFLTADTRAAALREKTPSSAENESGSVVYFPEGYDYADAEFINEEGEWVLVRQTAPDTAQRGMHDINTSDTPYDRLIRMERAARYGAAAAQTPAIPSSGWARLFQPVNNWLGLSDMQTLQASAPNSYRQASSTDGLGRGASQRPTERFARRRDPAMPQRTPDPAGATQQTPDGWNLLDILDPTQAFERLRENVEDWFQSKNGARLSPTDKDRRDAAMQVIQQQQALFRQGRLAQIAQDAADEQAARMQDLFSSCSTGNLATYQIPSHVQEAAACDADKDKEKQDALQEKERSIQRLTQALGFAPPPLNVVIVMGKEQPRLEITEEDRALEPIALTKEYYNYLSSENCSDGECYWVASSDDAEAVATALGGELYVDPLGVQDRQLAAFKQSKLQQAQQEGQTEKELQKLANDLEWLNPPYVAYNAQQWRELQTPTSKQGQNEGIKPSIFVTPTAANAQTFAADTRVPAAIFYDTTGQLLNIDSDLTPAQQGALISGQMVERIYTLRREMEQLERTLARMRLDGVVGDEMQKAREEFEQMKREWEQLRNMQQ